MDPVKVDVLKLKPGIEILMKDGQRLRIRGAYMAPDGLVVRAKDPGMVVERNCKIEDIKEILT